MKMTGRRWLFATLAALGLACMVSIAAEPVTATPDKPITSGTWVTLNTNGTVSFLSGPLMDAISTLGTATNWGVAAFGIYRPSVPAYLDCSAGTYCVPVPEKKASYGGGVLALFNLNTYFAAGLGFDMLDDQTTMPSCQFQLQLPVKIGGEKGVTIVPFGFTGAAIPVGGTGDGNGTLEGLYGAGMNVKLYGGLGAFYAIEQRTGQDTQWHLFGLSYSKAF